MANAKKTAKAAIKEGDTQIRILADTIIQDVSVKANTVVEVNAETAKELVKSGIADDDSAAVEFALSENPEVTVISEN